ncbi:MAG: Do family serine endopeptidase [Endomicrobia bacterium]|nr:Do family serine endopeptidase [Endomicrobiia bacterium]
MRKELFKLSVLIVFLIIGIILVSDSPVLKQPRNKHSENISRDLKLTGSLQSAHVIQESFIEVIEKVKPAVVSITTVYTYEVEIPELYFGDPFEEFFREFFDFPQRRYQPRQRFRQYKAEGGGSGVIISPDGYILTNEHVIKNATEIKVIVNVDGKEKEYKGKVIGKDPRTDIAVIKIPAKNLPYAKLGDSDKVRIGEWVVAIGSPFGLEQTVTVGIVSALRQRVRVEGREYREFIQTDAAINRGNSGGPLCNLQGEVIGINTAIYAPTGVFSGIGFAIPINQAKQILDTLIEKGKVSRGWLGVEIVAVDEAIAKQFGLEKKQGVLVNRVLKDTPAEKAGLQRGDIIIAVKFRGKTVEVNTPTELQDVIFSLQPKEKVELKIFRDGKEQNLQVVLGELPEEPKKVADVTKEEEKVKTYKWLGHNFVNLTQQLKEKLDVDEDIEGVVVEKIDYNDKDFEDLGLMELDVIISVNRNKTSNVDEFKKVVKSVNLKDGVVFDIIRNGRQMYISYIKQ